VGAGTFIAVEDRDFKEYRRHDESESIKAKDSELGSNHTLTTCDGWVTSARVSLLACITSLQSIRLLLQLR